MIHPLSTFQLLSICHPLSMFQFYKVDVQKAGEYISEADLSLQISRVLAVAEEREQAPEVGILTSQSRDVWAASRERLMLGKGLLHDSRFLCK